LNARADSGSSSPKRKNPKNAVVAMAHNTIFSGLAEDVRELCRFDIT
jgi:hypothetical protein